MALIDVLRQTVATHAQIGSPALIERFVLKHGIIGRPRNPRGYSLGPKKQCFKNAAHLALAEGLQYVEGYVLLASIPFFPILHAWNVDESGAVIDITLRSADSPEYMGIPFERTVLEWELLKNGVYGLFDVGRLNIGLFRRLDPDLLDEALNVRRQLSV